MNKKLTESDLKTFTFQQPSSGIGCKKFCFLKYKNERIRTSEKLAFEQNPNGIFKNFAISEEQRTEYNPKIFNLNKSCRSISAKPTSIKKEKDIPRLPEKIEETVSKL